jgi:hypothetical protein
MHSCIAQAGQAQIHCTQIEAVMHHNCYDGALVPLQRLASINYLLKQQSLQVTLSPLGVRYTERRQT